MQKSWLNVLLVVVSVAVTAVAAEFLVRWLDAGGDIGSASRHLDEIATAPGVERAWFYETPPPLPNQRQVPEEWNELVRDVEKSGITEGTRRADMFKAWNSAFVGDPCRHAYLCGAPGHLFVYDPPRDADGTGETRPPYRFLPNATTPIRLTTNAYGFRGPPVPFQRQPKDGAHRLHRRLDHGQQPLLPVLVPRIHRQLAQPVGRPAQARSSGSRC